MPAFFVLSCSRVPVPVVVVFVICSFGQIKKRFCLPCRAFRAGVVRVGVRDVWTQHAQRKRANLARLNVLQVFAWEVSLFCMHYLRGGRGARAATTVWCKRPNFF